MSDFIPGQKVICVSMEGESTRTFDKEFGLKIGMVVTVLKVNTNDTRTFKVAGANENSNNCDISDFSELGLEKRINRKIKRWRI